MTIPATAPGLREEAEAALWSLEVDTGLSVAMVGRLVGATDGLDELGFSVATVGSGVGFTEGTGVGLPGV